MICKKCNTENITKAKYCSCCGNAFDAEERKAAYDATLYGKLDKIGSVWDKITSIANLSIITDNVFVKYGILVLIIVYGLFAGRSHGNSMTILKSNDYKVQYNESAQEYYVLTENDSVTLDLYLPKQAENIYIEEYYSDGTYCNSNIYAQDTAIVLWTGLDNYYVIRAEYPDSSENMKLFVLNQ